MFVCCRDSIASRHPHHGKRQKSNPYENRDQLQKSLYDIFSHYITILYTIVTNQAVTLAPGTLKLL